MNNFFFNFIQPILNCIDNGRLFKDPFKWIYACFAILNLLVPFAILYFAISESLFSFMPGKIIAAFIILWIIIAFSFWIGFQIWWNRKDKIVQVSNKEDQFIAIPVFAYFLQTLGEWAGILVAILGLLGGLVLFFFLGSEPSFMISYYLGSLAPLFKTTLVSIILTPIQGFLIIVSSRVVAELIRATAEIANNTRKVKKETTIQLD